jgi:hypothetical protein
LSRCLLAFITDVELELELDLGRDALEVERRTANEGLGYLGLELPRYWTWFVYSLDAGKLLPTERMRLAHGGPTRPAFLQELVKVVFDETGAIRPVDPEDEKQSSRIAYAVGAISTICTSFGKKYEAPLPVDKAENQLREFKWLDENQTIDHGRDYWYLSEEARRIIAISRRFITMLFANHEQIEVVDGLWTKSSHEFWDKPVVPRFGPGACEEGYDALGKYTNLFRNPPLKALGVLRLADVCCASPSVTSGNPVEIFTDREVRKAVGQRTAGLTMVPKDLGKGREIVPQENDYMYLQKAYQVNTYEWVEKHPLTRGFVNFTNQAINGKLALQASADRSYATLDMSRASNTVTRGEIGVLFDEKYATMLLALRNDQLRISVDGVDEYWSMNMHAAMGSALCFPVEAIVFWGIAKAALELAEAPNRNVYVYGDDLLVPNDYFDVVTSALSEMGHIVNRRKSFHKGGFRESCGVDAYEGYSVTPPFRISTRMPSLFLSRSERAGSTAAWVEYANLAEEKQYLFLAESIRTILCEQENKARAFPHTGELRETQEGYLAFFVDGFPSIRDTLKEKVQVPKVVEHVDKVGHYAVVRKAVTGGHNVYDPCIIDPHVPEQQGAQGSLFRRNCFMAPSKKFYAVRSKTREVGEDDFPDNLAYLRWQLEKPEETRVFPVPNALDIVRQRFTLS